MMPGPHAILVMRRKDARGTAAAKPNPGLGDCGQRLRHAPWGLLLYGDDPALMVLVLLFALVLLTLFYSLWPLLAVMLIVGFLIRAWHWCRAQRLEENATSAKPASESPAEGQEEQP